MIDCNDYLLTSPTSCPYPVIYDGLGRLKTAHEEISYPGAASRTHHYSYSYDMRSQLTSANIDAGTWQFGFTYDKDGNINQQTLNSTDTNYSYQDSNSTDIMTAAGDIDLSWDPNGRLSTKDDYTFIYNGDGKLREVLDVNDSPLIKLKYDPMGNRVYKWSYNAGSPIERNYIVDASAKLATILCEVDPNYISDPNDPNSAAALLTTSYIYANAQPICRYDVNGVTDTNDPNYEAIYFYVTDRLGNVRLLIDANAVAVNSYTYTPFGQYLENNYVENVYNPLKFTGQWYDAEIAQYYLRARQYDPELMRFISRDPVRGKNNNPLTLHPYLYCISDPINKNDPSGEISPALIIIGGIVGGITSAIKSGCDEWSDALTIVRGIGLGMFAGMLPNSMTGYLTGGLMSAGNTAFSTWAGGGDMSKVGLNMFFNSAGSGIGGTVGALFKNAGVFGYLGGEVAGAFYSWFAGETYETGSNIFEDHVDDINQNSN